MKYIRISNLSNQASAPILAKYCQSFFCQFRGLMFKKHLRDDQGLLLVQGSDSKISSSIHMMFMWMDISVIWINSEFVVVDRVLAHRWRLYYAPKSAAKYVLEAGISRLDDFDIGDKVIFEDTLLDADV